MKKVIWPFLLCVLFATTATAQPGSPRGDGDREPTNTADRVERLTQDLNLDENQAAKLLEIFTAADAERETLRKQHEEQVRQEACAFHKSITEQIKGVLTAEQSVEFDKLVKRKEGLREGRQDRRGKGRRPPMNCEEADA